MKRIVLLALSVATLSTAVAQTGTKPKKVAMQTQKGMMHNMKTPEERAQHQTNKLDSLLMLSADQKAKVNAASLKRQNTIKAAFEKSKTATDKKVHHEEIKAARTTYRNELNAILTPEQQAKLKAYYEAKQKAKGAAQTDVPSLETELNEE
jgi:periplasmic protein CpxP/Spy